MASRAATVAPFPSNDGHGLLGYLDKTDEIQSWALAWLTAHLTLIALGVLVLALGYAVWVRVRHRGRKPRRTKGLPKYVGYEYRDKGRADVVPFAKNAAGKWVSADLTNQCPHVLIAGSTGDGKSSIARVFIAHMAAHGALVMICDPKFNSLAEFDGCPNIQYQDTVESYLPAIAAFRAEVDRRNRVLRDTRKIDGPPMLLVLEEAASLYADLDEHWNANKPQGARGAAPTKGHIRRILLQGRTADCHVLALPHQPNADILTTESREMYALKILAGLGEPQTWQMMFPGTPGPESDEAPKGRGTIRLKRTVQPVQLAYLSAEDGRDLALRGRALWSVVCDPASSGQGSARSSDDVALDETAGQSVAPHSPDVAQNVAQNVEREPVKMRCKHCANRWVTTAESNARCPRCKVNHRIPVKARSTA